MNESTTPKAEKSQGPGSAGASTVARRTDRARTVETWVDEHGHYLFQYALPRIPDRHAAEEIVQETFLAALKGIESFRGDSSPRTWLVAVLRRKIADYFRKHNRDRETDSPTLAILALQRSRSQVHEPLISANGLPEDRAVLPERLPL